MVIKFVGIMSICTYTDRSDGIGHTVGAWGITMTMKFKQWRSKHITDCMGVACQQEIEIFRGRILDTFSYHVTEVITCSL